MKQYLKPSMLILSCQSLGAKLQGTGQNMLVCSGQVCEDQLGSYCGMGTAEVHFLQENATCPAEPTLVSCEVTALSINDEPVTSPDCFIAQVDQCNADCKVLIICATDSKPCERFVDNVQATVSCSGFGDTVECITPEG